MYLLEDTLDLNFVENSYLIMTGPSCISGSSHLCGKPIYRSYGQKPLNGTAVAGQHSIGVAGFPKITDASHSTARAHHYYLVVK